MLDRWFRFHEIAGEEDNPTYQRIVQLRRAYGPYQIRKGDIIDGDPVPPEDPMLLRLPHKKGTTPHHERPPTESELAEATERPPTPLTQRRKARYRTRGTAMASPIPGCWHPIQSPRVKTRAR